MNFEEQPGLFFRNVHGQASPASGPQGLCGSHGGRLLHVVPEHLRPATQAESLLYELSGKEFDGIQKVLSSINVGDYTDLVGQPPPTDFDLERPEFPSLSVPLLNPKQWMKTRWTNRRMFPLSIMVCSFQ